MLQIEVTHNKGSGSDRYFWILEEDHITIGPSEDCDIRIDDGGTERQFRISYEEGAYYLETGSVSEETFEPVNGDREQLSYDRVFPFGPCFITFSRETAEGGERDEDEDEKDAAGFDDVASKHSFQLAGVFLFSLLIHLGVLVLLAQLYYRHQQQEEQPVIQVAQEKELEEKETISFDEDSEDDRVNPETEKRNPKVKPVSRSDDQRNRKNIKGQNRQRSLSVQPSNSLKKEHFRSSIGLENTNRGGGGPSANGPFSGRLEAALQGQGPNRETNEAVLRALVWLAKHQSPNGRWDAVYYTKQCGAESCRSVLQQTYQLSNPAQSHDMAATSLALLAYLGAGITPSSSKIHEGVDLGATVRDAIKWLRKKQEKNGSFMVRSDQTLYTHAIATMAMCEAYGMTGKPELAFHARKAVKFLLKARNARGVWRYFTDSSDSDTSVTGWCLMALKSANLAGFHVPESAFQRIHDYIRTVTDRSSGRVAYQPGMSFDEKHIANVAVGMLGRSMITKDVEDEVLERNARIIENHLPPEKSFVQEARSRLIDIQKRIKARNDKYKNRINFYYWYYATLALYQYAGPKSPEPKPELWDRWNERMSNALLALQRTGEEEHERGSWDAIGRWTVSGGRVITTALNTLTLEVYYRYSNVFTGSDLGSSRESVRKDVAKAFWQLGQKRERNGDLDEAVTMYRFIRDDYPRFARQQSLSARIDELETKKKARSLWELGRTFLLNDMKQSALRKFQEIQEKYPNSTYASRAKKKLREIREGGSSKNE